MFNEDKISGKGKRQLIFVGVVILLAVFLKIYSLHWPEASIIVGDKVVNVLVANNYNHLVKGLSKRKNLGEYDGMLFVFNRREQHTMVMRDMRFPIDIIWIDSNRIIDIAPNAQIEPNKREGQYFPYLARDISTHVLEVPAGTAERMGWKIGDTVDFNP